jgi:tetratricopeptide (TPR) repeat protein
VISHEVTVKSNVFVALSLAPVAVVVFSGRALADKIDKQYRHAAEIFRKGDLQGAAREFEEILRRKPGYEKAKVMLGLTHYMLGQEAERKGDQVGAAAELGEALRLEPDEAYWHSALAAILNKRGDAQGAARECAQAAELSPDDSGLAAGCGLKGGTGAEKKVRDDRMTRLKEFTRSSSPEAMSVRRSPPTNPTLPTPKKLGWLGTKAPPYFGLW